MMFYKLLVILGISGFCTTLSLQAQNVRVTEDEVNTEKVFIEANREKILGNLENSIYLYKEVLKRDKKNHAAAYELARVYDALDKDDKAIKSIRMAILHEPDNSWYQMLLGDLYEKQEDFEKAAEVYQQLATEDPRTEYYFYKWGYYLVRAKKAAEAIEVYDRLEAQMGIAEEITDKKYRLYVGLGKPGQAALELQKLVKAYPNTLEYRFDLAKFYEQQDQTDKAKDIYGEILKLDPENGRAALALTRERASSTGTGNTDEGQFATLKPIFSDASVDIDLKIRELIPHLQQLTETQDPSLATALIPLATILEEVHPEEAKVYAVYGDVLYYSGQQEKALEKYQSAVDRNATVFTVFEQMMYIQAEQNDMEGLQATTEKAIELFPNQAKGYYFNGIAQAAQGKTKGAISTFRQALLMSRRNPVLQVDIYNRIGTIYYQNDKFEKSDKAFEKALTIKPDDFNTLNNYSYYLASRPDQLDKAKELSSQANELSPNNASLQDTYGYILYRQKDYKEAKEWLSKALKNGGDSNPVILEHYADVLLQLNDQTGALEYWQKALDNGGDMKRLEQKLGDNKLEN